MSEPIFYTEMVKIDSGTTYKVVDIQSKDIAFAKPVENIFTLANDLSVELKGHLMAGNTPTIPVATYGEKGAGGITIEDFVIDEPDELAKYKQQMKNRVFGIFSHLMASVSGLRLFKFFMSYSLLASNGYFITQENREEKYLEIINTGNEILIENLETYLDSFDFISPISTTYTEVKQFEIDIEAAITTEEIDELIAPFEAKM